MLNIMKHCLFTGFVAAIALTSSGCQFPRLSAVPQNNKIPEVTEANFSKSVLQSEEPVLIWFFYRPDSYRTAYENQHKLLEALADKHHEIKVVKVYRYSPIARTMGFSNDVVSQAMVLIRGKAVAAHMELYPHETATVDQLDWFLRDGPSIPRIQAPTVPTKRNDD